MAKAPAAPVMLEITPMRTHAITLRIIGNTPMFFNSMSVKAKRTLLLGGGRKTAAEKKDLKHNPFEEFASSVYSIAEVDYDGVATETLLGFPAGAIKSAMATGALETAGVTKKAVERLLSLPQEMIPIWGIPQIRCDVVRSADMNKTPDIRTRAFLPRWCSEVVIGYAGETLNPHAIVSLLTNAGVLCGIGDYRQEKGRGAFGTFRVVSTDEDEAEWQAISESGGREAQLIAMSAPEPANPQTLELLEFFDEESKRRSNEAVTVPKTSRRKKKVPEAEVAEAGEMEEA